MIEANTLPTIFILLMSLAILVYAILDGYDLGVGILLPGDVESQRNTMIASIGPFWDANETWLVLAIGILLIAFPAAHNIVLRELYLPTTFMLTGLILRGVAFDFRAKAITLHKSRWDAAFKIGSALAALSQGYMLGAYVMGFDSSPMAVVFSCLSAFGVAAAYSYIGGAWLVMKTEGELQIRAARWTRYAGWLAMLGITAICIIHPLLNENLMDKWFGMPQVLLLFPMPVIIGACFLVSDLYLKRMPHANDLGCWIPFTAAVSIFFLCFIGLAYSFYPYVVPNQLTIWEAASAPESLAFILVGVVIVIPVILAYTIFSYRVFWGKATELKYH